MLATLFLGGRLSTARHRRLKIAAIGTALFSLLPLSSEVLAEIPDRVRLLQDHKQLTAEVRIQADAHRVRVADIARGVARLNGYDDQELRDVAPRVRVPLHSRAVRWTMDAFNWLMKPCVRCEVQGDPETLNVKVDRRAARRWVNDRKAGWRAAWPKSNKNAVEYGITLVDEPRDRDIVVLVHGLNSRSGDLAAFLPLVRRANLSAAMFSYPNDQPIDESAGLLSVELKRLRRHYPQQKICLLTHSMGGLVARTAIELSAFDPGNVNRLIMVAPPNQGSALASVAAFMDCYEFVAYGKGRRPSLLVENVADGLGEATSDLVPRSAFLDYLNHHARNPNVSYTILLGSNAPLMPEEMQQLRQAVRGYTDDWRMLRFAASKLNRSLDHLDEVVDGQGDGAVSVERGRLQGVSDVVVMPFSHGGVLDASHPTSQQVYRVILDRLQSPASVANGTGDLSR